MWVIFFIGTVICSRIICQAWNLAIDSKKNNFNQGLSIEASVLEEEFVKHNHMNIEYFIGVDTEC